MLRKLDSSKMGSSNLSWLKNKLHFSFAEYYNPNNMNFGVLLPDKKEHSPNYGEYKFEWDERKNKWLQIIQ